MKYPGEESSNLEFKESIPENDQIIKTIIGFCNQKGGKLVIGVNSNGEIIGLKNDDIQRMMEFINKSIFEASYPPIIPLVYIQTIADKIILIIEVSAGMNKPYYRKSEGLDRGTYIRLGRSTLRATSDVIEELKWQSRGYSYDMMPVYHTSHEDLDMKKISEFLDFRKTAKIKNISNEVLKSYNLIVEEHSTIYCSVGGILLFGKKPQKYLTESMIICSHFSGISGRNVIATIDCEGNLFEQFNTAYNFVLSKLEKSFTIEEDPRRKEKIEIPKEAIREIIINAIVHRNYHINAPSKIAIYDNRIEIFSPGTFPGPIDTQNLKKGLTYIRNNVIYKIFREARYIEKLGSGFLTLFSSYEKANLATPSVIEGENFIKCILPRKSFISKSFDKDKYQEILNLFQVVDEISVLDVMKALKISRSTAGRRLFNLTSKGLLIQVGEGKATRYRKK